MVIWSEARAARASFSFFFHLSSLSCTDFRSLAACQPAHAAHKESPQTHPMRGGAHFARLTFTGTPTFASCASNFAVSSETSFVLASSWSVSASICELCEALMPASSVLMLLISASLRTMVFSNRSIFDRSSLHHSNGCRAQG